MTTERDALRGLVEALDHDSCSQPEIVRDALDAALARAETAERERDAALARAETAERERDAALSGDAPYPHDLARRLEAQSQQTEAAIMEREALRAELSDLRDCPSCARICREIDRDLALDREVRAEVRRQQEADRPRYPSARVQSGAEVLVTIGEEPAGESHGASPSAASVSGPTTPSGTTSAHS
jgi:multidrug efflux pump subunit AcrA (membrane-fusion protein)